MMRTMNSGNRALASHPLLSPPYPPCMKSLRSRLHRLTYVAPSTQSWYGAPPPQHSARGGSDTAPHVGHGQLPVEVCKEIFRRAAPIPTSFARQDADSMRDIARAAYCFAATCRHWRDVAHKTPELWQFIYCRIDSVSSTKRFVTYVRTNLRRSAGKPLYIVMHTIGDAGVFMRLNDTRFLDEMYDLLAKEVYRWRRCLFEVHGFIAERLYESLRGATLFLEELIMLPPQGYRDAPLLVEWDEVAGTRDAGILPAAPSLRRLESHVACAVPMDSLRRLTYLSISLRDGSSEEPLWHFLKQTPALTELHVYFSTDMTRYGEEASPSDEITLPNLEILGVYGIPGGAEAFYWLNMPRLRTLVVSAEWCWALQPLCAAVSRMVKHVVITSVEVVEKVGTYLRGYDADALSPLLNVETIELRGLLEDTLDSDDLKGFFAHLHTHFPRLRRLLVSNCRFRLAACRPISDFVQWRQAQSQPFKLSFVNTVLARTSRKPLSWYNAFVASQFAGANIEDTF
ncbi:hypothetical protein BKA62DRAFT_709455 [Auriculariales sp. MPI-PUGE-AT-0066]|nr:hypothetical protein BKA62DRAFT_709455 [Auriculariales sp. MPI-PUGE-AT-0066]